MRERHDVRVAERERPADRLADAGDPEELTDREPADGDDEPRAEQEKLVLAPVPAEADLRRRRVAVPAP